jgi:N-acetylglucosamine-6-phosphate deacetylase
VAERDLGAGVATRRIEGLLAPGFIDIQVNGGGGVMFNVETTPEGIAAIGAAHRIYGTTGFLPTFITDTRSRMAAAIAATDAAIERGVPGVLGCHIEGPFLNVERKGAHLPELIRPMEERDVEILLSGRHGRTLVTIAPEKVPADMIRRLTLGGVLVSAGHTAGTYDEIIAGLDAGVTCFTHLYNAMPSLTGREAGPVGAAIDDDRAYVGMIVDFKHVSAPSLRIAIAAGGWERMILVSDAMPSVGSKSDVFELFGRIVTRKDGALTLPNGTLAGSDLDMASAVRNSVEGLGLPLESALAMASRIPAEFLGLGSELGRVAPGFRASLVLLDEGLRVKETWIDGAGNG